MPRGVGKERGMKFKYVDSDQMMPILEATEAASVSGAKVMKAFFFPSGLLRVLTALEIRPAHHSPAVTICLPAAASSGEANWTSSTPRVPEKMIPGGLV